MAIPENVTSSQTFRLHKVIYNQDGYSFGVGKIMGNNNWLLAMRWNGIDENAVGFPYAGKNPLWFVLHTPELSFHFLSSLLNYSDISRESYNLILDYLKDYDFKRDTEQYKKEREELTEKVLGKIASELK